MTKETGTLAELNVQPGDVVEWIERGKTHTIEECEKITYGTFKGEVQANLSEYGPGIFDQEQFRLISRASDTPKTWGEMTDAEKKCSATMEAIDYIDEAFDSELAQRIRDELGIKPEPKRETVTLFGRNIVDEWVMIETPSRADTHTLSFDTLDGEPICGTFTNEKGDTIRMEKIGEDRA